jgi:hypothetical protein
MAAPRHGPAAVDRAQRLTLLAAYDEAMTMVGRVPGADPRDRRAERKRRMRAAGWRPSRVVGVIGAGLAVACLIAYLVVRFVWLPGIPDEQDVNKDYNQIAAADMVLVAANVLGIVACGVAALSGIVSMRTPTPGNGLGTALLVLGLVGGALGVLCLPYTAVLVFSNDWD